MSFVVLSYNYETYISKTIQSVLDQTFSDFEIVVVDDASSDGSREVIRSFGDRRIRLHVNEQNLGGAASYNRAVALCRGEYLVNLDADDWIDPRKTEVQLQVFENDPSLDILGTYVSYVDELGKSHRQRAKFEEWTNRPRDLNLVSNWIGTNFLCRSSTMMRRAVHDRIGLDEPEMARAPDYELWTRALYKGCRFGVVPESLTFYRLHGAAVTHGDPRGTFLEICYLTLKNIIPTIENRATFDCFLSIVDWIISNDQFLAFRPEERYRLLGAMITPLSPQGFAEFQEAISCQRGDPVLTFAGRRLLVAFTLHPSRATAERFSQDIEKFIEARDFWHAQSDHWEHEYAKLEALYQQQENQASQHLSMRDLARRLSRWTQKKGG